MTRSKSTTRKRYRRIEQIDGRHPLCRTAPSAVVPYAARRRHDSRIAFFNFDLAREIGLIAPAHPCAMTRALERSLLESFSLVIVNEWDRANAPPPPKRDRRPFPYMATRYLQLQHPDKRGLNSGDGRSIWNGVIRGRTGLWDVSSCGTGVTRLCPATSILGRFLQTGNADTDYGCGTAHIEEGIGAALMSEAFARNDIRTERVLAVLALPDGLAINVRVAPNLLRPSHFFGLLRRREDEDLRRLVLYHADREIRAGRWPKLVREQARVRYLARRAAIDFARAAASFESEYIFCWLDWDGDNVLTDGSIIDYGSVRQFGLYHHRYRFRDTDRLSTSIPEQKRKARQIVQRFVQIRELLERGLRPALRDLAHDPVLHLFDDEFERHRRRLFLRQIGFRERDVATILRADPKPLGELLALHRRLERRRSSSGEQRVPDGLTWNAVYCMRDVLRELPTELLKRARERSRRIPPEAFYAIALSDYASRADRQPSAYRRRLANAYQRRYLELVQWHADRHGTNITRVLRSIAPRARARNPYARMTGDGLTHATRRLTRARGGLTAEESFRLVRAFADTQERSGTPARDALEQASPRLRRIYRDLLALTRDYRESL